MDNASLEVSFDARAAQAIDLANSLEVSDQQSVASLDPHDERLDFALRRHARRRRGRHPGEDLVAKRGRSVASCRRRLERQE